MSVRAAYFDVDGTIARTTIVTPLIFFKEQHLGGAAFLLWKLSLLVRGPYWLIVDRIDRMASNRAIYASYGGMPFDVLETNADACHRACIQPRLFPAGIEHIRKLQKDGFKVVLVTGGLDVVMRPLAREINAELLAPSLAVTNGVCTGALTSVPLAGEQKAIAIHAHAKQHNVDLAQSFAFGDAFGDLQMLQTVGHPVAVNADSRLTAIAREKNWKLEHWRPT